MPEQRASKSPYALIVPYSIIFAVALSLTACASSDEATDVIIPADQEVINRAIQAETVDVRLALPLDPVWEWLKKSEIIEKWEKEGNINIQASNAFDQLAAFAGGHTDIAVIDALRVPQLIEQSEHKPVIIGKLTHDRSFLAVGSASDAKSIGDLRERRVAIDNSLSSAPLWNLIVSDQRGFIFSADSPDYELVTVEPVNLADLVIRGDVDACTCLPEAAAAILADAEMQNQLIPLYGGRTAAEIYATDILQDPNKLPVAKVLVANEGWYADNTEAVDTLLALWDEGLAEWSLNKSLIIADYPHLFSANGEQEISWVAEYAERHPWYTSSVYITQEDADLYMDVINKMQDSGFLTTDYVETPQMIIHPLEPGG